MMTESKTTGFRVPRGLSLEDLDQQAKQLGMTRSQMVSTGVEVMMAISSPLFARLETYSKGLSLPVAVVIKGMLLDRIAFESAWSKTDGSPRLLLEFVPMPDESLFPILEDKHVKELKEAIERGKEDKARVERIIEQDRG